MKLHLGVKAQMQLLLSNEFGYPEALTAKVNAPNHNRNTQLNE